MEGFTDAQFTNPTPCPRCTHDLTVCAQHASHREDIKPCVNPHPANFTQAFGTRYGSIRLTLREGPWKRLSPDDGHGSAVWEFSRVFLSFLMLISYVA
jgi:hypothetical protein